MSEFKFACPVCGQHMMCDVSHGGSVMECPTCFQKIAAPQAPGPDSKFILTGTKVSEKKINVRGVVAPPAAVQEKTFPLAVVIVLVLVIGVGAGVFFFGGKLFHPGLAKGWQTQDIGSVLAAGSVSQAKGVFTVTGDGADIWDQADSFRYVFQPLTGDGTLTARVLNIKNTHVWAKAGVMIRESLNPDSAYALAFVSPSSGIAFQQRDHTAAPASGIWNIYGQTAPYWVRLVRQGDTFSAFASADGTEWAQMGTTKISMGGQVYAGLVVCSHNAAALCQAQFDRVTVEGKAKVAPPAPERKPASAAPPVSDTKWTLLLDTNAISNSPAAGRIHGRDFVVERAAYQNGMLILRAGTRGAMEFGLTINFSGAQPESVSGQSINVTTNADKAARVTLRWKEGSQMMTASIDAGYAMQLEFGALTNNRLPGKIHLCTPDAEKSYLVGSFTADARKPKPKASPQS